MTKTNNIKDAAKEISRFINVPDLNSRLAFLFGAGINANLADESISWSGLAKNAMLQHVAKHNLTKYQSETVANELIKEVGDNKFSLAFSDEVNIGSIRPKKFKNIKWFRDGFDRMSISLNNKVEIMTLNYDLVLENILSRKPVNMLNGLSSDIFNEILHPHGLANQNGKVSFPSILTIQDYVKFSPKAEIAIRNFLKGNDSKEEIELENKTLIMIGTSLKEEHILRAIGMYSSDIKNRNAFLICHSKMDDHDFIKLKSIYNDLGIKLLNIRETNDYSKDLKKFWEELSEKIGDNSNYSGKKIDLSSISNINDTALYFGLEKALSGCVGISWEKAKEMYQYTLNEGDFLLRPLYWLEAKGILKKDELRKFFFRKNRKISLEYLWILNHLKLNADEIDLICREMNVEAKNYQSYGNDRGKANAIDFCNKYFDSIDFSKYKSIKSLLIRVALEEQDELNQLLTEKIESEFTIFEIEDEDLLNIRLPQYPHKDSTIVKLMKNSLKINPNFFELDLVTKDLLNWILGYWQDEKKSKYYRLILALFEIDEIKGAVIKKTDELIERIVLDSTEEDNYWRVFVVLCYIYLRDAFAEKFVEKIKGKKLPFTNFPRDINYLGHGGSYVPKFSKYDGLEISEKNIDIESFEDICSLDLVAQSEINSVILFLQKNISIDTLEKVYRIDKLKKLGRLGEKYENVELKCKDWKEYLAAYNIKDKYLGETDYWDFDFLKISPPFEIHKRISELVEKNNTVVNPEDLNELLDIIEVRKRWSVYSGYIGYSEVIFLLNNYDSIKIENTAVTTTLNDILNGDIDKLFKHKIPTKWLDFLYLYFANKINDVKLDELISIVSTEEAPKVFFERFDDITCRVIETSSSLDKMADYSKVVILIENIKNVETNIKNKLLRFFKKMYIYHSIKNCRVDQQINFTILNSYVFEVVSESNFSDEKYSSSIYEILTRSSNQGLSFDSLHRSIFILMNNKITINKKIANYIVDKLILAIGILPKESYIYDKGEIKWISSICSQDLAKKLKKTLNNKFIKFDN